MSSFKKLLFAFGVLLTIVFFWTYREDYLLLEIPGTFEITSPEYVTLDNKGNTYIVDSSRERILRINKDDEVDLVLKSSDKRFSQVLDLSIDDEGNIYVLNNASDALGIYLSFESIQKYSPSGKLMEEAYTIERENKSVIRLISQIITNPDDTVSYIILKDNSFIVHNLSSSKEEVYEFQNAKEILMHFDIDKENKILVLTRKGELYRAENKNNFDLIYKSGDSQKGEDGVVPWGISVGEDGNIYITDLGNRRIGILKDKKIETVYTDEGELQDKKIYYSISAKNNNIAAVSESDIILNGESIIKNNNYKLSTGIVIMRILIWIDVFLLAIGIIIFFIWLFKFLLSQKSFVINLSVIVMSGVIIITVIFGLIVVPNISSHSTNETLNRIISVSQLTSKLLPKDAISNLDSIDDYQNNDYTSLDKLIKNIFSSNESYDNMYCVIYKVLNGSISEVYSTINYLGDSIIVNFPHEWKYEGSLEQEILETGETKSISYDGWADGDCLFSLGPIYGENGEHLGLIEIGIDLTTLQKNNTKLLVNIFINITAMSVSLIMIAVEIIEFINLRAKYRSKIQEKKKKPHIPLEITRMAVFLVFFASNISSGFLTLYAKEVIEKSGDLFGLSSELLMALPLSIYTLFMAVMSIFGTRFCKKIGILKSVFSGAILFVIGYLIQFSIHDILALIIGNALCGFSAGLFLMIVNLILDNGEDEEEVERGWVSYTVSLTSGTNSGIVFGSFFLNWLPKQMVIGFSVIVAFLLAVFAICYISKMEISEAVKQEISEKPKISTFRFVFSPKIFITLGILILPMVSCSYYLYYLFPVVGFDMGISENNIGYSFLLNSLVILLFGTFFTNFFYKKLPRYVSLCLWITTYVLSFAIFIIFQNVTSLLISLVLLGFADAFGINMYYAYYDEQPQIEQYGYKHSEKARKIVENFGEIVGPMLFGYVLNIGIFQGLKFIIFILIIFVLIFLISNIFTNNKKTI
ncbi:MAG: MFS transporter [Candidatus Paraimprobicoccus trichonymphae]|uniref:MFS transporter n=1 Tax=Candidatus Paraimprobicoccus trichonymphae TaxID=3033793 RepID=A0AA48HZ38_9FIRM|nr:MAG: MFS transporter [Candidatus Paraimprobicoccus trichonymphae]